MATDISPRPALRLVQSEFGSSGSKSAEIGTRWEADLVPVRVPKYDADIPDGRSTVVMVTAGNVMLHAELFACTPSDPDEVAKLVLAAIDEAREANGRRPVELLVRHQSIARYIEGAAPRRAAVVTASRSLPYLDRAVDRYELDMVGLPRRKRGQRTSRPLSWAGWQAPRGLIDALFIASADVFRIRPWLFMSATDVIEIRTANDRVWWVVVMGGVRRITGISIYESADDVRDMLDRPGPLAIGAVQLLRGAVISVIFEDREKQSPQVQRELWANKWELAEDGACPVLVPMNTPGGGVSREQIIDLVTALDVLPEFIREHVDFFVHRRDTRRELAWTDPLWKATMIYTGRWAPTKRPRWAAPAMLALSGPQGRDATPGAFYTADTDRDAKLREHRTVALDFKRWLLDDLAGPGLSVEEAVTHARVARMFVHFLAHRAAVPVTAVNELDLRRFVYGIYMLRRHETEAQAQGMLDSLERFFEYLDDMEGIECPWRADVLDDHDTFMDRWEACPELPDSQDELQPWIDSLTANLRERALLPPSIGRFEAELTDENEEIEYMLDIRTLKTSDDERILTEGDQQELERRRWWLTWRDEEIRAGVTDPESLRNRLEARLAAASGQP